MGAESINDRPRERVEGSGSARVLSFWEACPGHPEGPVLLALGRETLHASLGHCRAPEAALSMA